MGVNEIKKNKSRRNFLKQGLAGIAGAAVIPSALRGEASKDSKVKESKIPSKGKIIFRKLGKTGIKLPIVSMGVMNADNPNLVKAALDAGIVHLDTAWYYQMGRNEEMIGKVVKDRPRDSFVVATKIYEPRDRKTGLFPKDAKADTFLEKFETSLKRLGMSYVDILYIHNISKKEAALFEVYVDVMKKLKKQGKVRFIGISTHRNEAEMIRVAADSKIYDVVLTSYNFRMNNLEGVTKAIDYAAQKGLGIVAMKTQAGVYWDGKEKQHPINMKAALKWALQNKNIHTSIPGFTTFDQLNLDLSVMEDLKLTPEEKADLVPPKELASSGFYCQQCEKCLGQCSADFDIPTLMRSYMYAYGYKNLHHARATLEEMGILSAKMPCSDCDTCSVKCSMGFQIKERVLDIARLKTVPQDILI